jgi:hypothetical protein
MKVFGIRGSKEHSIDERVILLKNNLGDKNEEPIEVMQPDIQVVTRKSTRSVQFKTPRGGRRTITRKKNRTL